MKIEEKIIVETDGARLDKFLAEKTGLSRENIKKIISSGSALVNEKVAKSSYLLRAGDEISVEATLEAQSYEWASESNAEFQDWIIYMDDDILVLNKPIGIIAHPGAGNTSGTIANFLLSLEGQSELPRAGVVHRLDKDTSGLMVVARTLNAYTQLVQDLQIRKVKRTYMAIVFGKPRISGSIDAALGRDRYNRLKMAVVEIGGKDAITHYERKKTWGKEGIVEASLVEISLETGRTHQIRVHFTSLGNALIGDALYKPPRNQRIDTNLHKISKTLGRQALHATKLEFAHPITGKELAFDSELPNDFAECIANLDNLFT